MKQLKKTVVFITLHCRAGKQILTLSGTGFFVLYPDQRLGKDGGFTYLVTNRHVAECWDEKLRPQKIESVSVRVNLADGSSEVNKVNGSLPWFLPADESVDLALLPIGIDQKKVEYLTIPTTSFVSDEVVDSRGISEGTRIVFSGFFVQFQGEHRMQPIVREGVLAMMPDENMVNTTGKRGKVYLGDVHIFGGNSGSPVFVDLAGLRNGAMMVGEDYRLLGIVSGYFYEDEDFSLKIATVLKGNAHANSGIAVIVPATELESLLTDSRVEARRDADVALWKERAK